MCSSCKPQKCLINQLPAHLADMATFALATGLRMSNVTELEWSDVDLNKKHAWIHPDQAKAEKAIRTCEALWHPMIEVQLR